jgi:hypothetical protein
MTIELLQPPFENDFEEIIPTLYSGTALQIKQSQAYAKEHLRIGFGLKTGT